MNRVRLLPIVIVAASGLLVLKATELVSGGGRLSATADIAQASVAPKRPVSVDELPPFARALARHRMPEPGPGDITGTVQPGKDGPAAQGAGQAGAGRGAGAKEAGNREPAARPAEPMPPPAASERAVLERLQERRGAIEDRAREMDMREALLQAAERRLDGRINDLREVEGRLDAGAKAEKAEVDRQLKLVATMYEAMKPKDAARVFDRLKLDVLVPIALSMKSARMAEILAAMSPEAAERLTVALASRSVEAKAAQADPAGTPPGELPRLRR